MRRATWVTAQRAGCPQTSPSHSRQWGLGVRDRARLGRQHLGHQLLQRVALGGVERVERARSSAPARAARIARITWRPSEVKLEPDGAAVTLVPSQRRPGRGPGGGRRGARRRVRQAQRCAQRRQRHPRRVVVQRDERRGLAGADVLRGGHRVTGAVADRHGEGAEEVPGPATAGRHPPDHLPVGVWQEISKTAICAPTRRRSPETGDWRKIFTQRRSCARWTGARNGSSSGW